MLYRIISYVMHVQKHTPTVPVVYMLLFLFYTHITWVNKYSLRFICVHVFYYLSTILYRFSLITAATELVSAVRIRIGLGFRCADHCWPSVPSRTFDTCVTLLPGALLLHFFFTACHPLYFRNRAPSTPPPLFSSGPSQLSPRDVVVFFFPFLLCRGVALGKPHDCEKPEVNIIYIYREKKKCLKKNTHFITRQTN